MSDIDLFARADDAADVPTEALNFRLLGNRNLAKTWRERAADNLAAIKLAKQIEVEGRPATEDEQEQLIKFIGFGQTDLSQLFPVRGRGFAKGWENIGRDLHGTVTPDELAALARATQYAHYTPEYIVRAMWRGLRRIGFTGGAVMDPGCGTGLFLALMPEGIASRSSYLGIEADPTTARIAKLLHPESDILHSDFTKAKLTDGYDLAIGNPPFSARTVHADDMPAMSLHDHFIARSVKQLRPGGIGAFVVSRYTMDKQDTTAREYIRGMADLLAAIRLPAAAMRADAGTDVVVDVLFFIRRGGAPCAPSAARPWAGKAWLETTALFRGAYKGEQIEGIVNEYFAAHPHMVLGKLDITSSEYGPTLTCLPALTPVDQSLPVAMEALPQAIYEQAKLEAARVEAEPAHYHIPGVEVGTAAEGAVIKEGSYFLAETHDDAKVARLYDQADYATGEERRRLLREVAQEKGQPKRLFQIIDGHPVLVPVRSKENQTGIFGKHARIIAGLVAIRDAVRAILRAQEADQPYAAAQAALHDAYAAFLREFGPVNLTTRSVMVDPETGEERITERRPNLTPFMDDPDCWLVASIASFDIDTGKETPGRIFFDRVIKPHIDPHIVTALDALAVVLNELGRVDLDSIADRLGKTVSAVMEELDDGIYFDPAKDAWVTSDDYLSGPVRTKLARAQLAAESNPELRRNVEALERVQPEDLKPSDITARLGAPWIPCDVVVAFVEQVMGIEPQITHTATIASWTVEKWPFAQKASATSEWGTNRRHAGHLVEDALNNRVPKVYDSVLDAAGKRHQVLNVVETEAAKDKLQRIKQAFENWVWKNATRAERLVRLYNDQFNNLVTRVFDGSHLTLPGASTVFTLRPHQTRAIWRIVVDGSTYLAHVVGAGKTLEVIAGCMEQRRLGLVTKPMIVVPGHTLAQWAREWMLMYPNARILVADEANFAKDKRARFLARAATDNWDAIIITHSAFKFIATPAEFERRVIQETLTNFEEMLEAVDDSDRVSRKRLERIKENLEAKLAGLETRKDDMLTISEIGIDQIGVDEAQEFRKLTFATNLTTLKGIDPDGSQRAWDLHVKVKFIETKNPGRGIIMASGTPITNTMGELFTVLRFLFEAGLYERSVHEFDAWASTFGDAVTDLELQPSGLYKPVTRFAKFVNVPELIAMFRMKADVVGREELREYVDLPRMKGGKRQLITAPASPAFKAYQRILAERIKLIEKRRGPPKKGDDIMLSVITDGRHAAIDTRFAPVKRDIDNLTFGVSHTYLNALGQALKVANQNDPENKLNAMIDNAFRIWKETSSYEYRQNDGTPFALPGAAQMIFSDLGTEAVAETRGFSAYTWIKQRLVEMGVPANQIAFMQHFKKASEKLRLFSAVSSGHVRVLIGSSETMGTGVNAQLRLKALHHLDVPWIPAWIEQREGRIERQGNQNAEIEVYAYATLGSVDATMWQTNERKKRFIDAAMNGDRSIRVLDDAGSQVNQFAMAKAIASGDPRLMHLAGLESEVARLYRLERAHFDDQHVVRRTVEHSERTIALAEKRIPEIQRDLEIREPTRGDAFKCEINGNVHTERSKAADIIISRLRMKERAQEPGVTVLCKIGGFEVMATAPMTSSSYYYVDVTLERTEYSDEIKVGKEQSGAGLLSKIEHKLGCFEDELLDLQMRERSARRQLAEYGTRVAGAFEFAAELAAKSAELIELKRELAATKEGDFEEGMAA